MAATPAASPCGQQAWRACARKLCRQTGGPYLCSHGRYRSAVFQLAESLIGSQQTNLHGNVWPNGSSHGIRPCQIALVVRVKPPYSFVSIRPICPCQIALFVRVKLSYLSVSNRPICPSYLSVSNRLIRPCQITACNCYCPCQITAGNCYCPCQITACNCYCPCQVPACNCYCPCQVPACNCYCPCQIAACNLLSVSNHRM